MSENIITFLTLNTHQPVYERAWMLFVNTQYSIAQIFCTYLTVFPHSKIHARTNSLKLSDRYQTTYRRCLVSEKRLQTHKVSLGGLEAIPLILRDISLFLNITEKQDKEKEPKKYRLFTITHMRFVKANIAIYLLVQGFAAVTAILCWHYMGYIPLYKNNKRFKTKGLYLEKINFIN